MHPYQKFSYFLLGVGLLANIFLVISAPLIPGVNTYIVQIAYADPLNGTLNDALPYQNLTSIRLGNWGACFYDDGTYTEQHGVLCTRAAVGYSVTLVNETGDKSTIVPLFWTVALLLHAVATVFFIVAMCPFKGTSWRNIALGVNIVAAAYDLLFYALVHNELGPKEGVSTTLGPSIFTSIAAACLLIIGLIIRAKTPSPEEDEKEDG